MKRDYTYFVATITAFIFFLTPPTCSEAKNPTPTGQGDLTEDVIRAVQDDMLVAKQTKDSQQRIDIYDRLVSQLHAELEKCHQKCPSVTLLILLAQCYSKKGLCLPDVSSLEFKANERLAAETYLSASKLTTSPDERKNLLQAAGYRYSIAGLFREAQECYAASRSR